MVDADVSSEKMKKAGLSKEFMAANGDIFGDSPTADLLSAKSPFAISVALWKFFFTAYGKTISVFLCTFLMSGWVLRQIAEWVPYVGEWLYKDGIAPPPPLAERAAVSVLFMLLSFGAHALVGILGLAAIAAGMFVWTWLSSSGPVPDLKKFYGEGSWAAVVMPTKHELGMAFCKELAKSNLNLVVISPDGMRSFCTNLEQTYDVQVQPFELPLSDTAKLARAWASYDLALVVFVAPWAAAPAEFELGDTQSLFEVGALGAQRTASAAVPKLVERASKDGQKAGLIFASSLCGVFPTPGRTAQSVADSAVAALASSLSTEIGEKGVNVLNAPCTGLRDKDNQDPVLVQATARSVLLGLTRGWKVSNGGWASLMQMSILSFIPLDVRRHVLAHLFKTMAEMQKRKAQDPGSQTTEKTGSVKKTD